MENINSISYFKIGYFQMNQTYIISSMQTLIKIYIKIFFGVRVKSNYSKMVTQSAHSLKTIPHGCQSVRRIICKAREAVYSHLYNTGMIVTEFWGLFVMGRRHRPIVGASGAAGCSWGRAVSATYSCLLRTNELWSCCVTTTPKNPLSSTIFT